MTKPSLTKSELLTGAGLGGGRGRAAHGLCPGQGPGPAAHGGRPDRGRGQAARGPPAWTAATHVIMCACMFVLCTCSCVCACVCDHVCLCVYELCACTHVYSCVCAHRRTGAQVHRVGRVFLLRPRVLLRVFLGAPCKAPATLHLATVQG